MAKPKKLRKLCRVSIPHADCSWIVLDENGCGTGLKASVAEINNWYREFNMPKRAIG